MAATQKWVKTHLLIKTALIDDIYLFISSSSLLQFRRPWWWQCSDKESGSRCQGHDGPVVDGDVELDVEERVHPLHAHLVQLWWQTIYVLLTLNFSYMCNLISISVFVLTKRTICFLMDGRNLFKNSQNLKFLWNCYAVLKGLLLDYTRDVHPHQLPMNFVFDERQSVRDLSRVVLPLQVFLQPDHRCLHQTASAEDFEASWRLNLHLKTEFSWEHLGMEMKLL